jgi:surface polysaccharide O-acyltransferase-like enzyme
LFKENSTNLQWVDTLRILAAFAVVLLHVSAPIVLQTDLGSIQWWIGNIADSSVRWCVPVFVLISGALLLDPTKEESLSIFYQKRAKKLLVPLVFWSLVYFVFRHRLSEELTIKKIATDILAGRPYYHLWYLYMVAGLYIFTPFFRTYVRASSQEERSLLITLTLLLSSLFSFLSYFYLDSQQTILTIFIPYIGYYLCGHQIRSMKEVKTSSRSLLTVILMSLVLISLGTFILVDVYGLDKGLFLYDFVSPPVVLMSVALFSLVRKTNFPGFLKGAIRHVAPTALGIYVIHPIIISGLGMIGLSSTSFTPFLSIPLVSIVAFLLSCLATLVMSHIPYVRKTVS